MNVDQRIRAIRLLEMIEEERAMALELGVSVRQRAVERKSDAERKKRWEEGFEATAR